MSFVSRILGTRNVPVTLHINGGDDDLLKGPFGYDFAMAAYLCAMRKQKLIDTMKDDDYKSFVEGKGVEVLITGKESDDILRVMIQLGNGTCIRGDELTDVDFRKSGTVLTVGCIKRGKNYNFVFDNEFDLQPVVHKCLLELWKAVYGLEKSDPDFVDKLLELHWQYNPDEEKPQPQQPARPAQKTRQQPTTPASAGVQTDANGVVTIGKFYRFSPAECNEQLTRSKKDNGTNDQNDATIKAMADCFNQSLGIYLRVRNERDATQEERGAEAVRLLGIKTPNRDGKSGSDNGAGKDASNDSGKKATDNKDDFKEEFRSTPYKRCLRFGSVPKMDEGELIPFENIRAALSAVKAIVFDEDSSRAKMRKFAKVWDVLQDIINEASAASRTDVGNVYLHYKLGKINSFGREFSYNDTDYELIFGTDENK